MKVKPVKANSVFTFYIDFENLHELELGALLYALRPNDAFRHKIGLGKPLGLGTVRVQISELQIVERGGRDSSKGLFGGRFDEKDKIFIEGLKNGFRSLNADICDILETLGNPDNLQACVHYPTRNRQSDEGENFKWFVENDKNRKRNLLPIKKAEKLPT